jgi:DNA-binding HxlR family transcriptional regulator
VAFDGLIKVWADELSCANALSHPHVQLRNVLRKPRRDRGGNRVLELFSVKWTTMVLHSLHFNGGTCRTGVLARSLPGCSKKMLTQTLREMERDRLIDRKVYPVVPPMAEYSLTPMGRLFIEPIEMLYAWAAKNDDALSNLRRRRNTRLREIKRERFNIPQ